MQIRYNPIWPMGAELPKPEKLKKLWDDDDYVAEIKVSGERLTLTFTGDQVRVSTRSGGKFSPDKPIEVTHRWPQIQQINVKGIPAGTILDGEAFSKIRREEEIAGLFNYRSNVKMPDDMKFIAFDCVYWGSESLEETPWHQRRLYLEKAINIIGKDIIEPAAVTHKRKKEFFETVLKYGGEGVVLKHILGKYVQGKKPANVWVKAKKKETYDCVITGFKPGKGKYKNMIGSVELSQYKEMGKVGEVVEYKLLKVCNASGIDDELRKEMTENPEAFLGRVAVVDAYERVPGSVNLKQPRIKWIRPEGSKDPKECIIEEK